MAVKGTRYQKQAAPVNVQFPRGGAYYIDQLRDIDFTGRSAGKAIVRDGSKYIFAAAGGSSTKTFSGNPEGVVTPDAIGQLGLDLVVNSDGGHNTYVAVDVAGKKRQQLYVVPNA